MPQPNIKIYLALSGILAVILIIILVFPFGKKSQQSGVDNNSPTPTGIESRNTQPVKQSSPTISIKEFTGVEEEQIPESIAVPASQKQELRSKVPFDTGLFKLDFDYSEDKFMVTIYEPKTENLKQFEDWKRIEYPEIPMDQFIFN